MEYDDPAKAREMGELAREFSDEGVLTVDQELLDPDFEEFGEEE